MDFSPIVLGLIQRYGRVDTGHLTSSTRLDEAGVDVLALADIVMDLERRFSVELDLDGVLSWTTATDIVRALGHAVGEEHRAAS